MPCWCHPCAVRTPADTKWPPFPRRDFQMLSWMKMYGFLLKFQWRSFLRVSKGPINNITTLFQKMAWPRIDAKPLSETILVSLLTYAPLGLNEVTQLEWWVPGGITKFLYLGIVVKHCIAIQNVYTYERAITGLKCASNQYLMHRRQW